ncbi:hypothetical protein [Shewanella algae]|nr:hypothetical protein [Shewanella algae]
MIDYLSAMFSGSRAHFYYVVGIGYHLEIMLDDYHCFSLICE